jgi:hypothetical protein
MTIALTADQFRGTRRWRLTFSGPLASGAFTSTSYYAIASADQTGPTITVEAVFAIASDPNSVELSASCDFTAGALYIANVTAVPAADSSTCTGSITDRVGQPVTAPPNVEPETSDYQLVLYQEDIAWGSAGFAEDATGDLLTISGRPNWQGALSRRMISDGVTWDATYGAKAQQYVDAPDAYQPSLAGLFLAQARLDDRTKSASIDFSVNPNDPQGFGFSLYATGRDNLDPVAIAAPIPPGTQ